MEDFKKFFFTKNMIAESDKTREYEEENYLETIDAFARLTYQSIYVIDYANQTFEYVSENPLFLCGYRAEEVRKLGYNFYFSNVKKDDLELLFKINEEGFNFFDKLEIEDRKLYSISYDFHLINKNKSTTLINHKLTPLFLSDDGKILKALCIVSLSPNHSSGNIKINKHGSDDTWEYNIFSEKWLLKKKIELSSRNLEILRLSAQGLTISEIAEKMCVSVDTVKFHKKKLFAQLEVSNMTEALMHAAYNKLL